MKKPKKETRDVIAKHVRWTEALRVVRAYHPEVTIILPEEKIQILPGDDVRAAIAPMVGVIRRALDAGVGQWHGYTETCRVRRGCSSATTSIITRAASVPRNLIYSSKTCSMCIRLRGRYVRMRLRYHSGSPPV